MIVTFTQAWLKKHGRYVNNVYVHFYVTYTRVRGGTPMLLYM